MTATNIEKSLSTIIAILSVGALLFLIWCTRSAFNSISDFPEYYAPARLVVENNGAACFKLADLAKEEHKFFPAMGTRVVLLFIPPPGLAIISSIGLLGPTVGFIVWKSLLIACLIGAIVFFIRTFALTYKQTCYLIAGICLSHACYEALRIDQLAPILLLALSATIYFLRNRHNLAAGIFLSLIVLKPQQFLPLLAYLGGARYWQSLLVCLFVICLLTIISFCEIGQSGFYNYWLLLSSPESLAHMQPELNPTLRGQLLRLLPSAAHTIFSATSLVYIFILGFSYFFGQKNKNKPEAILWGILTIMPLALITSLHCHSYDLLLLVPSLIVIFSDTVLLFSPTFKLFVILGSIIFLLPLSIILHYDYLLKGGQINFWFIELLILILAISYKVSSDKPQKQ